MLIDTHTHLTDSRLSAVDIINNMQSDRLEKLITVGYDVDSSLNGLAIAEKNDNVFCSLGIHPSEANSAKKSDISKIAANLSHPKVVAAGEIGLDYHYDDTDKARQQDLLVRQIEAYAPYKLPFIFHLRDAYEDMYSILSAKKSLITAGAVMHCFSGSLETALDYVAMGFYISFSGTITYPNAKKFPKIIKTIPRGRLLIETDCPYLAPQAHRGKTNQPAYVKYQAAAIASILGESVEYVEELTRKNAYRLFTKLT